MANKNTKKKVNTKETKKKVSNKKQETKKVAKKVAPKKAETNMLSKAFLVVEHNLEISNPDVFLVNCFFSSLLSFPLQK